MTPEVQAKTRETTLTLLLRQGESSASNLASFMGISVQAMRRHLRSLEEDGLVHASSISIGPGRPSNLWKLTQQGHNRFDDGAKDFALELFGAIEANLSPEMMADVLKNQTLQKANVYRREIGAGKINDRLKKLIELRLQEGYFAEFHVAKDGLSWYLKEFNCSIRGIAEKFPVVCDQELELIRQIFPDCQVNRIQWRLEQGHYCGFHITPINCDG